MTTPLLAVEFNPDTRPFAFGYRTTEGFDKRLDVGEHNGRRSGPGKDRHKRLTVSGIHAYMISNSAITNKYLQRRRAPHQHGFDRKPRMNTISEGSVWRFAD